MTVELEDNGSSTGYSWNYTIEPEGVVEMSATDYIDPKDTEAIGAAGTRTFTFTGLKAGTATVTFRFKQSWMEDSEEDKIVEAVFQVDQGLMIQRTE